jgi:hypothetical protein
VKFKLGSKVYAVASLDLPTLSQILKFEAQSADVFGHPVTFAEIGQMSEDLDKIKDEKAKLRSPDGMKVLAVTIWASRVAAGEDVTLGEAVDFSLNDLTFLSEAGDPPNPTTPRPPRKGSGAAGKTGGTRKASSRVSTGG